jgi:hypothetical protein
MLAWGEIIRMVRNILGLGAAFLVGSAAQAASVAPPPPPVEGADF